MSECEFIKTCAFFNDRMSGDSGLGALYKRGYCRGDSLSCARYIIAKGLGKEKVPERLYPNQQDKAFEMLSAHCDTIKQLTKSSLTQLTN